MADYLNGLSLDTLSTSYLNTASSIAQNEATTIFSSLGTSDSTTTDSAAFSLASIAALADGGATDAAEEAAATSSSTTTPDTTIPSTAQSQQTILDSFAGTPAEPLVSLPAPALAATTPDTDTTSAANSGLYSTQTV